MSDIKIVNLDRSSRHDLWHGGEQDTSASGAPIYFICEYLEKLHHDEETDEYYKFCKHKKSVSKTSLNSVIWTAKSMDDVVHAPASAR